MRFNIPEQFIKKLRKGTTISYQQIVAFATDPDKDQLPGLLMMGFRRVLEKMLLSAGKVWTIASINNNGALAILTDEQASRYNSHQFGVSPRQLESSGAGGKAG